MAADWILVGPVALDERFADDRYRLATARVTLGDVAPALERYAHRLEVPRRDEPDRCHVVGAADVLPGVRVALDRNRPDAAAERRNRQETDEAGRPYAGQRPDVLKDTGVVGLACHDRTVLRHRELGAQRQHALGVEPGIDRLHGLQRANQETG